MEEEENYDLDTEKNLHRIEHNIEKQKQERYAISVSNMKDNRKHSINKIFNEI